MAKPTISSNVLNDIVEACAAVRVTLNIDEELGDGVEGWVYGGVNGDHRERVAVKIHRVTLDGFEGTFEHSKTTGCVRLLNYIKNPGDRGFPVTVWECGEMSLRDVLDQSPGGIARERCLELFKPVAQQFRRSTNNQSSTGT